MNNFSKKDKKRPIKNYWSSSNTSINLVGLQNIQLLFLYNILGFLIIFRLHAKFPTCIEILL